MITLATDRYSSFQQLAQVVVAALVSVERSAAHLSGTLAVADSRAVQNTSLDISAEDWDLLFGAVLARLVWTSTQVDAKAANGEAQARSNRTGTAILECVQALEQLRTSAPRM